MINGLPDKKLCPEWDSSIFYGLADYRGSAKELKSINFNIVSVSIGKAEISGK